jgi:hypothetical protein
VEPTAGRAGSGLVGRVAAEWSGGFLDYGTGGENIAGARLVIIFSFIAI